MALLLISYVRDRKRATTKGNFLKRKAGNLFQDLLLGGAADNGWYSVLKVPIKFVWKKTLNFIEWILFEQCLLIKVKSQSLAQFL